MTIVVTTATHPIGVSENSNTIQISKYSTTTEIMGHKMMTLEDNNTTIQTIIHTTLPGSQEWMIDHRSG